MRRRTLVFIVCSPTPRTGVTTTARLLTDYYLSQRAKVAGFDTDPRDAYYGALFPEQVDIVDIAEVKGQISLFDRLLAADEVPKVVDVWRRSYDLFFSTVREIGYFEEARRVGVQPVILFMADPSDGALAKAQALRAAWPDLTMLAVQNEGAAPLEDEAFEILSRYPASGKFVIPALEKPIAKALDEPDLSLSRFLLAPPSDMSIVVRAALKAWIVQIFTQFRSFELRLELESSDVLR
jgi:hypothetical protein